MDYKLLLSKTDASIENGFRCNILAVEHQRLSDQVLFRVKIQLFILLKLKIK